MRRTFALALFTVAVASASTAAAQDAMAPRAFTFGVSAGLSIPTGDAGDVVKTGFNAGAHLAFKPAMLPFGVRVEGQFNQFGLKSIVEDDETFEPDGNYRIISGTVNGVFGVPAASSSFRPYVIGGVGMYNQKFTFDILGEEFSESETKFGLNGGAGIEFGLSGLSTFVEARYHIIFNGDDEETGESGSNTKFIPISFGIKF
jgi:opacity protein-like surface antigen